MRPALLVAAWTLVCALATGAAGLVRPSELFMPPGSNIALLPEATMVGIVEADLQGVASAEACAEQCRGLGSSCDFMAYCNRAVSVGSSDRATALRAQACRCRPPPLPLQYRPFPTQVCAALLLPCRAAAAPRRMAPWTRATAYCCRATARCRRTARRRRGSCQVGAASAGLTSLLA